LIALVWFLRSRKGAGLMLSVNVAVSVSVLAYQLPRLGYSLATPPDEQLLALIAFEFLVLATAWWASGGRRLPLVLSCIAFGLHLCASLAAVVFVLTFRIDRLF
jgi:hypothetical protein